MQPQTAIVIPHAQMDAASLRRCGDRVQSEIKKDLPYLACWQRNLALDHVLPVYVNALSGSLGANQKPHVVEVRCGKGALLAVCSVRRKYGAHHIADTA